MSPIPKDQVKKFLLSGRAILTATNHETGNHKTFKISVSEEGDAWFVRIRGDKDSTLQDSKNWVYMGMIKNDKFMATSGSKVSANSQSFRSFRWLYEQSAKWAKGFDNHPQVDIQHEGCCGRCGRQLTDPISIASGFGPECIKKI